MTENLLIFLLGAAFPVAAYFFKRWWEGEGDKAHLDKQQRLLAINKELTEQGLTVSQLRALETSLIRTELENVDGEYLSEYMPTVFLDDNDEGLSQAELNQRAVKNVKIKRAIMEEIYFQLELRLRGESVDALKTSQDAWDAYSRTHAEFVSSLYGGGSMQSMIYSGSLEGLISDRIGLLKEDLEDLQR